jgi:aminoglycoside phosphotransferase (APT) family kinase protein
VAFDELTRPDVVGPLLVAATGNPDWAAPTPRLIAGGKSNLTFELTSPAGSLILRRPPSGHLLARAHDMGREARIQRALGSTAVPVARIILEHRDSDVLGVPFYVMEKAPGVVLRDDLPEGFASQPRERAALADALIDTLAAIHRVDPSEIGLDDFGKPQGFAARQVRTWTRQWEASKAHDVEVVNELASRLSTHQWDPQVRGSIVHGDYRFDNCLFDSGDTSRINAVLDWELSTLGDPLADLGMLLFYWVEPGEVAPRLTPAVTAKTGFPGRRYVAERYGRAMEVDLLDLPAYVALAHFKFVGIAQGIAARVAARQMADQDFGDLEDEIVRIATLGLAVLEEGS